MLSFFPRREENSRAELTQINLNQLWMQRFTKTAAVSPAKLNPVAES